MGSYIGNTHVSGIENACGAMLQTLKFAPKDSDSYYAVFWDKEEFENDPHISELCEFERQEIYYSMDIKPDDYFIIGRIDEERIKRNINTYTDILDLISVTMYIRSPLVNVLKYIFVNNYTMPQHNIIYVNTNYKDLKILYNSLRIFNKIPENKILEDWIESLPYFDIFIKE